jgi:hypothetical protein
MVGKRENLSRKKLPLGIPLDDDDLDIPKLNHLLFIALSW